VRFWFALPALAFWGGRGKRRRREWKKGRETRETRGGIGIGEA
jgi:hypothetical protein